MGSVYSLRAINFDPVTARRPEVRAQAKQKYTGDAASIVHAEREAVTRLPEFNKAQFRRVLHFNERVARAASGHKPALEGSSATATCYRHGRN
jgi:hypothetical protein